MIIPDSDPSSSGSSLSKVFDTNLRTVLISQALRPKSFMSPQKGSRPSSSSDPWVRCPRAPCIVSYHPRNTQKHFQACRYFRCSNLYCSFLGAHAEIENHQTDCPYGLGSEEIGTTDPLSESSSDVLDILTSPAHRPSYPTEPSSEVSHPSPTKKSQARSTFQPDRLNPLPVQNSHPLSYSVKDDIFPPISSSSKDDIFPPSRRSQRPSRISNSRPLTLIDTLTNTSSKKRRPGEIRPSLDSIDPYHPSAKRIFSLPDEAICPTLKPDSSRVTTSTSAVVPSSPARKLSTYELKEFVPKPSSNESEKILELEAQLRHKTALLEGLQSCYQSAFDELQRLCDITTGDIGWEAGLADLTVEIPMDSYRRSLEQIRANVVPDPILHTDLHSRYDEEEEEEEEEEDLGQIGRMAPYFCPQGEDVEEEDEEADEEEDDEEQEEEEEEEEEEDGDDDDDDDEAEYEEEMTEDLQGGLLPPAVLSTDELRSVVRKRISENEMKSPTKNMDSPRNPFFKSLKRKRTTSSSPGKHPRSSFECSSPSSIGSEVEDLNSVPPTGFCQKLADTTWDPIDEIETKPLPSKCNFAKFIQEARFKIEREIGNRA